MELLSRFDHLNLASETRTQAQFRGHMKRISVPNAFKEMPNSLQITLNARDKKNKIYALIKLILLVRASQNSVTKICCTNDFKFLKFVKYVKHTQNVTDTSYV